MKDKFEATLLESADVFKKGFLYVGENIGRAIATITLIVSALVLFTDISFRDFGLKGFTSTMLVMLLASYLMYFSMEEAGEKLGAESEEYKTARTRLSAIADKISGVLVSLLGEEKGVLALGFFTGERSDLPAYIVRDFRRSGLSHIMAVSGSHIAILLGSIEVLLRRLFVPKGARCAVVSVCGLLFILITGFSLSGIRSVLMLYAVYLAYLILGMLAEKGFKIPEIIL